MLGPVGHLDIHDETLGTSVTIIATFRDPHQSAQHLVAIHFAYFIELEKLANVPFNKCSCKSASEAHIIVSRGRSSSCASVFSTRLGSTRASRTKPVLTSAALTKPPDPFQVQTFRGVDFCPVAANGASLQFLRPVYLLHWSSTLVEELTDLSRNQTQSFVLHLAGRSVVNRRVARTKPRTVQPIETLYDQQQPIVQIG